MWVDTPNAVRAAVQAFEENVIDRLRELKAARAGEERGRALGGKSNAAAAAAWHDPPLVVDPAHKNTHAPKKSGQEQRKLFES